MAGTVVLSDPEQLPRMAAALTRHGESLRAAADEATVASAWFEQQVAGVIVDFRARVRRAEAELAAVAPDDESGRAAALRRLEAAVRALEAAHRLRKQLSSTLADLDRTVRTHLRPVERAVENGTGQLSRFWERLGRAADAFRARLSGMSLPAAAAGPAAGSAPHSVAGQGNGSPATEPTEPIGPGGHVLVNVSDVDTSDSPVRGPSDFTKVPLAQVRDGLLRLERTVAPAVARGGGIEDMRLLDQRAGLGGHPASHVRVYEAFFGDTSIRLARGSDGRFTVINGYHRIWIAQQLGVDRLPAMVRSVP